MLSRRAVSRLGRMALKPSCQAAPYRSANMKPPSRRPKIQRPKPSTQPTTFHPSGNASNNRRLFDDAEAFTAQDDDDERLSSSLGASTSSEDVYPTFVPRNPGVKDGIWNKTDELVVRKALDDALKRREAQDAGLVLLGKSQDELAELAKQLGEAGYRGQQIRAALLAGATSLEQMNSLSRAFREKLAAAGARTGRSILHHSVGAEDGTRKFLLQLQDGRIVETVGIPADEGGKNRLTVCVSSQVGCPMRCTFCATGKGGFARNLAPHEIVDQVLTVQEQFGQRVSNVVFMGMGEPLLNLPAVARAYEVMNKDIGIGGRHITISTVGVPNSIVRLAKLKLPVTLAISIHAPSQVLREQLIPSAKAYPLQALMQDCVEYFRITGRRVSYEYTLMAGVNDQDQQARELAALLKQHDLQSHINLIPWNPVDESDFQRPSRNRVYAFKALLEAAGIPVSIRITKGLEAAAACGQLRNQFQKEPLQQFQVPT